MCIGSTENTEMYDIRSEFYQHNTIAARLQKILGTKITNSL